MAQNKKYSVHLQKLRMSSINIPSVDPALNSYMLMLLRSNPNSAIDDKSKPAFITSVQSKLSVLVDKAQHLSTTGNKHRKVLQALLRRICMHGFVPWNALVPLFDALHNQEANEKGSRLIHYLINTLLSCGAAGSPVPLLPGAGTTFTELAVDALPFTTYSQAWAVLGMEESFPTQRARLALRHLTSTTRCALTTLPAGKSNDSKAAQLLQDLKSAVNLLVTVEAREHRKKKKTQEEVLGLQKSQAAALLAARVALPRTELNALLSEVPKSLATASALGVRHGLAVLCRIPSVKLKGTLGPLSAPLRAAFEAYTPLGLMHNDAAMPGEMPEPGAMALDDWLARVYLGRLLAKLVFSGTVGGGQKQFLWKVLNRLAFSPKEKPQVRLEVWKALFGDVLPQPLALFPVNEPSHTAAPPPPFNEATEKQLSAFKATAWQASTSVLMPKPVGGAGRRRGKAATAAKTETAEDQETTDRFHLMVQQLLKMLEAPSAATLCGGARVLRCIAEARAHAAHAAGDNYSEDSRITEILASEVEPAVRRALESVQGPALKLPLLEALLWLHLPQQPTVTPDLLSNIVHASFTTSLVPGYAPWPPADVGAALRTVERRIRAAPEVAATLLAAVSAMASGAPSSMLPSALMRLWNRATAIEMAGGVHNGARDAALQAAVDLLATPPPPMCFPQAGASSYDLAIGMKESHAWLRLKDMAVTWLGDNANSATNELAWYPPPSVERKAPASHEKDAFGEAEMLCLMAMRNPMLMSIISQLQRTALAEAWHLRMAAALALGKIAVMSEEPFRIHCYTLLAALSGSKAHDPLGLHTSISTIVKVLDDMYAGQMVMKQCCDSFGYEWSKWPPDAFESVQHRHEELVAQVRLHITPDVPDGAFFPLGIKSQLLLTGEKVLVDEEALAEMQEHAIAKAERQWVERQREKEAVALAGAELYEEEEIVGEFDDAASEANTSEQSIALETISIDDLDMPEIDLGAELEKEAGERVPGLDPNAWANAEPSGFGVGPSGALLGMSSKMHTHESSSVLEALSSALSMPHHLKKPSMDVASSSLARVGSQHSPDPRASEGVPSVAVAVATGAPESDSDEEVTEAEAKAAMQSMGGGVDAAAARAGLTMTAAADSTLLAESLSMPLSARPAAAAAVGPGATQSLGGEGGEAAPVAVVAYGFDAVEAGEMTVREGDEVYVLEYLDGGWTHVQMVLTGEAGNVPDWAVELVGDVPGAWTAQIDGAPAPPAPAAPDAHVTGDAPAATGAHKVPVGPAAAAAQVVAGAEVTEDNPFGLIDISSPTAEEGEEAVAKEAEEEKDWLGGLGEIYTPQLATQGGPAAPLPDSVLPTGDSVEATVTLPQPPSLLSTPQKAAAACGDEGTGMPAVDNPFGTSVFGDAKGEGGESAPMGDNPFQGGISAGLPSVGEEAPAARPVQFPGGVSDNPFGGM